MDRIIFEIEEGCADILSITIVGLSNKQTAVTMNVFDIDKGKKITYTVAEGWVQTDEGKEQP